MLAADTGGLALKYNFEYQVHKESFYTSADQLSDFCGLTMALNLQKILIIMAIVEAINSDFAMNISRLTLDLHNKFRSQELGSNMLQMVEFCFSMRHLKYAI